MTKNNEEGRNNYIDILKGIGISCVVIGHASWDVEIWKWQVPIGAFVYLFHLAVFFFCSGYLYKEETSFCFYISKRLKSMYIPFLKYSIVYFFMRNVFIWLGMLDSSYYSFVESIAVLTDVLVFRGIGEFLGAFWFLPVLFGAMCLFAGIKFITKDIKYGSILRITLYVSIGFLGLYLTDKNIPLIYNMQVTYLMLPITAAGYIWKKIEKQMKMSVNIIGTLLCFLLLCATLFLDIGYIELSKNLIINKWLFYPVTFIGIVFCLGLGKLFHKYKWTRQMLSRIGRNSYSIMALHLISFKIIDLPFVYILNRQDILSVFPYSFTSLWLIYYVAGIGLPLMLNKVNNKIRKIAIGT